MAQKIAAALEPYLHQYTDADMHAYNHGMSLGAMAPGDKDRR